MLPPPYYGSFSPSQIIIFALIFVRFPPFPFRSASYFFFMLPVRTKEDSPLHYVFINFVCTSIVGNSNTIIRCFKSFQFCRFPWGGLWDCCGCRAISDKKQDTNCELWLRCFTQHSRSGYGDSSRPRGVVLVPMMYFLEDTGQSQTTVGKCAYLFV